MSPRAVSKCALGFPMTVCVAAIASSPTYPTIVAATDKLITAGDTTFDMRGGKRFSLGSRIVLLLLVTPRTDWRFVVPR